MSQDRAITIDPEKMLKPNEINKYLKNEKNRKWRTALKNKPGLNVRIAEISTKDAEDSVPVLLQALLDLKNVMEA